MVDEGAPASPTAISDRGHKVSAVGGYHVDGDLVAKEGDLAAAKGADSLPKDCKIPEGLENKGATGEPVGAKPSDLPGLKCDGAAEEGNSVGKDCNLHGFMAGQGTILGLRKGRKAVVPWRFQIGYKPKWAQDLFSGNRSRQTEVPAFTVGDGQSQRAPVMARNRPCVKGSASSGQRSLKVQKGTGSAPKKRKVDQDNHIISAVRQNVLSKLREFRII